ncbi:MAG: hypothetical protein EHM18_05900 [Acidobacteria bacterium]|nr:MAG: hypothetical protein EHM18_05900 [Acidobacteriota bacterium]
MKRTFWISAILCLIAAGVELSAGENPFVGTWKLNPEKSKFTGNTISYEQLSSGEWKSTAAGMSYTFRMDGKEHQGLFDRKVTWNQANERTWESTVQAGGKTLVAQRFEISPDDKTMKVTSRGTTPSGEKFEDVSTYSRQSGSTGLAGKWKSDKVQISSPTVVEFKPHGSNGISVMLPAYKASVDLSFDGTDTKATGPTIPAGMTFSAKKLDERTFEFTEKHDGKPIYKMTFKVSEDGKTITETGKPAGVDEPFMAVYDRQDKTTHPTE